LDFLKAINKNKALPLWIPLFWHEICPIGQEPKSPTKQTHVQLIGFALRTTPKKKQVVDFPLRRLKQRYSATPGAVYGVS
jgi:hypothetical protein